MGSHGSDHRDDRAMPPWRFWSDTFGFLLHVAEWADWSINSEEKLELRVSQARDMVLDRTNTFNLNRIPVPNPRQYRGTEFLLLRLLAPGRIRHASEPVI